MSNEIVLKMHIHCEGCRDKVSKCLRSFDAVQEVLICRTAQKVIVRGKNLDAVKVLRKLKEKYSRNVELISPKPNNESKGTKEREQKEDDQVKLNIIVLKMNMHCEACAEEITKHLQRMSGVMTVEPNMENSRVTVKGIVDPPKLVDFIKKRLGKHAEILNQETLQCNRACARTEALSEDYNRRLYPNFQYCPQCICLIHMFSDENPLACSTM